MENDTVDPEFCTVMVNDIPGAEFIEGNHARAGEKFSGTVFGFQESADGEPGEIIPGQKTFGRQVPEGIELRFVVALSAAGIGHVVQQQGHLPLGLSSRIPGFVNKVVVVGVNPVFDDLISRPELQDRIAIEDSPARKGLVEIDVVAVDGLLDPEVIEPGGFPGGQFGFKPGIFHNSPEGGPDFPFLCFCQSEGQCNFLLYREVFQIFLIDQVAQGVIQIGYRMAGKY